VKFASVAADISAGSMPASLAAPRHYPLYRINREDNGGLPGRGTVSRGECCKPKDHVP
jgi:hypothetical protein